MARTIGSDGEKTEGAIRDAAAVLFARHGYGAVSLRRLAEEVGVQPAALYRYFPTKEDLLFSLMRDHMDALASAWSAARPATGDPTARLAAFVEHHIAFHVARRHATQICNLELRSLPPGRLSEMLRLRNAYERELRSVLREGSDSGAFSVEDAALTAMAIIQMLTGVIVWFRPDQKLSVEAVTRTYLAMTLRLVGAKIREDADVQQHA